jgi:hypothetical protein
MMDIKFEKQLVDGELWSPSIYRESMYLPIRRWAEVEGQCVTWNSPFDEMTGECNGGFYVFEHGDLPRGRIHFAGRTGQRFNVAWTGELEVYPTCLEPFTLEAEVVFTGIRVDGCAMDSDASLQRRLLEQIELDGLVAEPMKIADFAYDDGMKMAHANYLPVS